MDLNHLALPVALALIVAKCLAELWLEHLNRRHVLAHADAVPPAFETTIDRPTYARSVDYTLARGKLHSIEFIYDLLVMLSLLATGLLPWSYRVAVGSFGTSIWAMAGYLFLVGLILALAALPLQWYAQFRLEARFGFNTTTPATWLLDRVKGFLLAFALGYPLLALLLKLASWAGDHWWLLAWATTTAFQLVMMVVAPVLILPLFNKFTPLPEGSLRARLLALAQRTHFQAAGIQVMDGSKRSRHSNAFFTGFGRFRKVVLFDTLVGHLTEDELEAVLAHEIGHYRRRHIPKMMIWSSVSLLAGFYVLALLAQQPGFQQSFGFPPDGLAPAFLLFGLLGGTITFWASPLINLWSRRFEYQADAFGAHAVGGPHALIGALRKLTEKNLSNLTPHPLYSGFYYSHPTLIEREQALAAIPSPPGSPTQLSTGP